MILPRIDRNNGEPIYRQIMDSIIHHIDNGTLHPDDKLPATRILGQRLGVDRSTIYVAYQELISLGYLYSSPGSYTKVRNRKRIVSEQVVENTGTIDWEEICNDKSQELLDVMHQDISTGMSNGFVDLSSLELDSRLYPVEDFRRSLNRVFNQQGAELLRYGSPYGYEPLRDYIANRMQIHEVKVSTDNILITNGAQQGLDLVMRCLSGKGVRIAAENPTYSHFLPMVKYYDVELVEIPMNEDGLDLDILEKEMKKEPISLLYTIPNFHNPTGITTPQEHREKLLKLCEENETVIIEDGFEEEMKYFGKVVLPIKSMDENQMVIYLGTFSKVLFPGIRMGWIACDTKLIDRLTSIKRFGDLSNNTLIQAGITSFCRKGHYDSHVKRVHREFRKRMKFTLNEMDRELKGLAEWTTPDGGYTIWVTLNKEIEEDRLKELMEKHEIRVSAGNLYFASLEKSKHLRLSISRVEDDEIREGIKRLKRVLEEI